MCSEPWRRAPCAAVATLGVLVLGSVAHGEDVAVPADASVDAGRDAGSPVCGADEKRARRAARAAASRLEREVKASSDAVVAQGLLVANNFWEESDTRWFQHARDTGRDALEAGRTGDAGLPDKALCRALVLETPIGQSLNIGNPRSTITIYNLAREVGLYEKQSSFWFLYDYQFWWLSYLWGHYR